MQDTKHQLEPVSATRIASEDIDRTFRSSCIGKPATNHTRVREMIGRVDGADQVIGAISPVAVLG